MDRSRLIYLTDLMLVPVFALSFYTGIELHVAGHGNNHEIWHNWAAFHVIVYAIGIYTYEKPLEMV